MIYIPFSSSFNWRRFTVPVLWDKKLQTIVNNESSEIIRMLNSEFNDLIAKDKAALDFYPEAHRATIDEINGWVYETVNSTLLQYTDILEVS